jgi:hypothetical protein
MALPSWLVECVQVANEADLLDNAENILPFPQRQADSPLSMGHSALDLVYQAAEAVSDIEDRARQSEARSQALCRDIIEKLRIAEKRAESAESVQCVIESRLLSAETKLSAAETRAKDAEARARELDRALTTIEEAIRTKLLGENNHRRLAGT